MKQQKPILFYACLFLVLHITAYAQTGILSGQYKGVITLSQLKIYSVDTLVYLKPYAFYSTDGFKFDEYEGDFLFFTKNDTIVGYAMYSIDMDKTASKLISKDQYVNDAEFTNFNTLMKKTYGTQLNKEAVFLSDDALAKLVKEDDKVLYNNGEYKRKDRYGYRCGRAPRPTYSYRNFENTRKVFGRFGVKMWLHSGVTRKRYYAIGYLYELKKENSKKLHLTKGDYKVIFEEKFNRKMVNSCGGCIGADKRIKQLLWYSRF